VEEQFDKAEVKPEQAILQPVWALTRERRVERARRKVAARVAVEVNILGVVGLSMASRVCL